MCTIKELEQYDETLERFFKKHEGETIGPLFVNDKPQVVQWSVPMDPNKWPENPLDEEG